MRSTFTPATHSRMLGRIIFKILTPFEFGAIIYKEMGNVTQ
jgi:hypothetical protein